ncbi:glycosyltransferase 87 family protein [Gordonia shandongensis]|uniref:glycosyltransferase 87 family protein n=1 Tax=Gordonia shandongensis TaxID=376351 RepID=UPI001FE12219|nr:glycosyltransferase 87 family protein [Gordonia shandongensis]
MRAEGAHERRVTWPMVIVAAAGAVLIIAWCIWVVPIDHPVYGLFNMGVDNHVYRGGAEAVWNGTPLYDGPVYKVWQFTYPPFAALILVPLAWTGLHGAQVLWNIGNVVCLLAVVAMSLRALHFRFDRRFVAFVIGFSIAVVGLEPVHTTLWNGQINLLLAVLVIGDLARRSGRWTGIGTGLAAGIKLTPIFYAAHLITTRRWRAAITLIITFAATIAIGIAVLGSQGVEFWTVRLTETGRIGPLTHPANQSLNGFFARLGPMGLGNPPNWLWIPTGVLVGCLGLWAAWSAHRVGRDLLAISITGMTSAAVSPFSWGHHWVWVVPLLLIALVEAVDAVDRTRVRTWVWALAPIAVVASTFTWWRRSTVTSRDGVEHLRLRFGIFRFIRSPQGPGWEIALRLAGSGAYVLLLLATIAVTLWWTRRVEPIRFKPTVSESASAHSD